MEEVLVPITVNEAEITAEAIAEEAQNHPTTSSDEAVGEAARALVIRELLLQEARRQRVAGVPDDLGDGKRESDEEALIRALLEREVRVPQADQDACLRFYANQSERFRTPELFEAAHILIAADAADHDAHQRAVALAEGLIAQLQSTPDRFEELARSHSACASARDGGHLGQLEQGQTTPEFESFLVALEEGQLSPVPVPTRYGAHVLRLDRRRPGRVLPFEEVAGLIAHYLQEASFRRGAAQYIGLLAGDARIHGIDLEGSDTPLVQ
jgi:peptidyl-prolyl cis-trans isomerase C